MIANAISMPGGATLKDVGSNAGEILACIDQYELLSELGGGGFGTVYLAKDTVSGVRYAVKGLPPFVKSNREELENIKANFALVSRLSHTNIARAYVLHLAQEVSYNSAEVRQKLRVDPGDTLMVMEYAPGITLSQWRKQFPDRKVPLGKALEIARQIASALDYAHEQKVLHRDVKPANVMIETKPGGELIVRVLDFGLAAEIRSSMGRVSREIHDTSGTRPYMAPEQWLGERQSPATDQYALAVLFHELVTGVVPFSSVFDTGDPVVMMNVVGREHVKLPEGLPTCIRASLTKALAKKPEDRFASCAALVAALEGKNSRCGKRGLITLALVLIGIGGVYWWMQNRDNPTSSRLSDTPSSSVQPAVPSVEQEEAERKAKGVSDRKEQQKEAEAEIDEALAQHYDKEVERLVNELRQVWRKQVKSIYDFAPPPYIFSGFKNISFLRRTHYDAAILAKKNEGKPPIFPEERIREIAKKMEAEFVNRGSLPGDRNRHRLIQASFALAGLGCKKALAFMFENEISDPNVVFDGGYLHYAAWMGRIDMIDFLLKHGAYVNMPDADGQTPVSWALGSEKRLATIRYLIGRGASIYNVNDEESLLQDAAWHGALDVVKYLVEELGYEPDATEYSEIMKDASTSNEIKAYLQEHGATRATKKSLPTPASKPVPAPAAAAK